MIYEIEFDNLNDSVFLKFYVKVKWCNIIGNNYEYIYIGKILVKILSDVITKHKRHLGL